MGSEYLSMKRISDDNGLLSKLWIKFRRLKLLYVIIVSVVPSALCNPDWSHRLTFDKIYNTTNYVQLQPVYRQYSFPNLANYHTSQNQNIGQNKHHSHSIGGNFVHTNGNVGTDNKIGTNSHHNSNSGSSHAVYIGSHNVGHNKKVAYPNVGIRNISDIQIITSSTIGVQNTAPRFINDNNVVHIINTDNYTANRFNAGYLEENELELDSDEKFSGSDKVPLLVGFSHDPFRYSVPEEDYLNGVRNMNPSSIMSKGENRGKRGVLHLYNMMYCATGCEPLAYKGYGCYCGFSGSGRPVDGIDRCCQIHDKCYENIFCPFFTVYFQPYYWKCYRGQPLCARENFHTQHSFVNGCAGRLCECDRKFAMCVKKYRCPRGRARCYSSPLRLLQNILMFP